MLFILLHQHHTCSSISQGPPATKPSDTCTFIASYIVSYGRVWGLRFEVLTAALMKSSIFWEITPCSPLEVRRFLLHACLLPYSPTLKMEVTCSSEISVDLQRTTQHYIPEAIISLTSTGWTTEGSEFECRGQKNGDLYIHSHTPSWRSA
jgi:hypothetical protein